MIFDTPLATGLLLKRYKRFFADVETPEGVITVHVPNTGSMKGCLEPHSPCLYSVSTDPQRKLKGTLQFVKTPTSWVGVNTSLPNKLAEELYLEAPLPHWSTFKAHRREVKINPKSRIDLLLAKSSEDLEARKNGHFIEVKNVTLSADQVALFPDAVTERGLKHLDDLMELTRQGHTAEIFFVVQRTDCHEFAPCRDIDPKYAKKLIEARDAGVKVSAFACHIDEGRSVRIDGNRPLKLKF